MERLEYLALAFCAQVIMLLFHQFWYVMSANDFQFQVGAFNVLVEVKKGYLIFQQFWLKHIYHLVIFLVHVPVLAVRCGLYFIFGGSLFQAVDRQFPAV